MQDITYLTSLSYERPDKTHCIVLSYYCWNASDAVTPCSALTEFAWVSLEQAKTYDLIGGIYEELEAIQKATTKILT